MRPVVAVCLEVAVELLPRHRVRQDERRARRRHASDRGLDPEHLFERRIRDGVARRPEGAVPPE